MLIPEGPAPAALQPVETSTAAFVGQAEHGPEGWTETPLRNYAEYEASFGGAGLLAASAQTFFDQGGRRLFVANTGDVAAALASIESNREVSLVAAPGIPDAHGPLIDHAERCRTRLALLDSVEGMTPAEALALRRAMDSSHAALFYPWLRIYSRARRGYVMVPPGAVGAGLCARVDQTRGVHRSIGGEPVQGASGLEHPVTQLEHARLNPEGVNCFRSFPGKGVVLWGARTVSSDPEWRYIPVRRFVSFVEETIAQGTQWAVFENNAEPLWRRLRLQVEDFLQVLWRQGSMVGIRPQEAYFVRCGEDTMTPRDIEEGRLILMFGLAAVRAGEFQIVRLQILTAVS